MNNTKYPLTRPRKSNNSYERYGEHAKKNQIVIILPAALFPYGGYKIARSKETPSTK